MFFALPAAFLLPSCLSLLLMLTACLAVGVAARQQAARHPVAVAEVLGRSGRVHLGILAAGVLGVLIAFIAEHGLPAEQQDKEDTAE